MAQDLTAAQQIEAAISPAPLELQEGATVLGYDGSGALVTLRRGTNDLTCLADDPADERFHVACYFNALEPFMKRGRDLRAQGKSEASVEKIRENEARQGVLKMPKEPAALYSYTGPKDAFDPETGAVSEAAKLYVIYMPYATEQTTGISTTPAQGVPWLMDPGKPWAHIMLMPVEAE
ncbi:MAG TPA: hypothetical protein VFG50_17140 [Rhodothermales bacterium]|nr:hypothetical protein [Rhodothermales bacterium]